MQEYTQSESIFTTCGSNSTGSWRWMRKDTCIATEDCPVSSWSLCCKASSRSTTAGECNRESSGGGDVGWICLRKIIELSGLGEPSGIALNVAAEDLLRSGTVAMDKVSTRESSTPSHCPQHTISASILQLRNFLLSSVLTCIQREGANVPFYVLWHFQVKKIELNIIVGCRKNIFFPLMFVAAILWFNAMCKWPITIAI